MRLNTDTIASPSHNLKLYEADYPTAGNRWNKTGRERLRESGLRPLVKTTVR